MYDLGGGTFDVSRYRYQTVMCGFITTSAGGTLFDERIVNYLVEQFKISDGINLSKDVSEEAEKAKELSSSVTFYLLIFISLMSKGRTAPH